MFSYLYLIATIVLAHASTPTITLEVRDPCKDASFHRWEFELPKKQSVGQVTMDLFDREKVPYIGSELGMNSILSTPVGEPSMEFPGPGQLKVYGWCFELNGVQPTEMPDKIEMKSGDHLVWFYGYALWKDREWKTYCSPAHESPLKSYCEKK